MLGRPQKHTHVALGGRLVTGGDKHERNKTKLWPRGSRGGVLEAISFSLDALPASGCACIESYRCALTSPWYDTSRDLVNCPIRRIGMNGFVCLASERLPVARGTLKKPAIIVNYTQERCQRIVPCGGRRNLRNDFELALSKGFAARAVTDVSTATSVICRYYEMADGTL